jgi:hypothetical protein
VAEALRRLPEDVVVARNARLKRAMDLSLKGTFLPEDLQAQQTPFAHYLQVRLLWHLEYHRSATLIIESEAVSVQQQWRLAWEM